MALSRLLKKIFTDPNFERKRTFLKSLELFKDLSYTELGHLAQSMHIRTYHEGEVLFMEGDIGRALFILESGRIELYKKSADGSDRKAYTIAPGDFFGEMALLEQLPRTATAKAVEKSRVYLLYRSKLDSILNYHPRIGVGIMSHLAQLLSARLRRATDLSGSAAATGGA
ncbi:MAG: cyclic nucleotide-binding domain-containing protein [Elusimicrobiota bacterium]|jgi:CRP-like cAMP-binding protein